ncbi:MAG: hypothetical protein MHM6MM_003195 [Cercozoa sp. M6MM]
MQRQVLEEFGAQSAREMQREQMDVLLDKADQAMHLRNRLRQSEQRATEMISFLQNELRQKSQEVQKLRRQCSELIRREKTEKDQIAAEICHRKDAEVNHWKDHAAELTMRVQELRKELDEVYEFKREKQSVESHQRATERTIQAQARRFGEELKHLERKLLVEKKAIQDAADKRIAAIQQRADVEARQALDVESETLRSDNKKLHARLKFHERESAELDARLQKMTSLRDAAIRDAELSEQRAFLSQRKSRVLQSKLIETRKALEESRREIERLKLELRRKQLRHEAQLQQAVAKPLQDAEIAVKHSTVQARELEEVRRLARIVLQERSDVEQFLVDAIEEVRAEEDERKQSAVALSGRERLLDVAHSPGQPTVPSLVKQPVSIRRELSVRDSDDQTKGERELFRQLVVPTTRLQPSDEPTDVSEFTREAREKVLSLLFQKLVSHSHPQATASAPTSD